MSNVRGSANLAGFLPAGVFQAMQRNSELSLRFADRAHKHLFHGRASTPDAAAPTVGGSLPEHLFRRDCGKTARWGDTHWRTVFPREPYTRDGRLAEEGTFLREEYFPQCTDVILDQLRALGLYPKVAAPVWNQNGGAVPSGFQLTMSHSNNTGSILYTLDGTDPASMAAA